MDISTTSTDDFQVVTVNEARIDAAVAIKFKDEMRNATGHGPAQVVLDLSKVDFIDSSGLGAIVAAMKLLGASKRLDLAGLTPNVDKVFRLTRMDSVFTIHGDLEQAVATYGG